MIQDTTFINKYTDLIYAATQLMRACCDHFTGQPNRVNPYRTSAVWEFKGKVKKINIKATSDDWHSWSNLIHINNVANCAEMIEAGKYDEPSTFRIFKHKKRSNDILSNRMDNSMSHLVRVPEVAKAFLLQFCEDENITQYLS